MRTGRAALISFLSAMILAATAIILFFALRGIHAADHSFTNPIKRHNGSDPYITRIHDDWYLMTTTYTELQITKANTLHDLKDAKTKTVWKGTSPEYCCNIGTPELHYIDGVSYIYFTAGSNSTEDSQRPYVLTGGHDPIDSDYSVITPLTDTWGRDGTVARFSMTANWPDYFIWSCMSNETHTPSICIAPFETPLQLGKQDVLMNPSLWSAFPPEGLSAYFNGVTMYLSFTMAACSDLGAALHQWTWDTTGDPTSLLYWQLNDLQFPENPQFPSLYGKHPVYAPRHNSIFHSPNGNETWMLYDATDKVADLCDGNRFTMAQKLEWTSDGALNFTEPVPLDAKLLGPMGEFA